MVLGAKRGGHWFDSGGRCLTPRLTPKNSRMSNCRVHLCGFEVKDPFDKHRDDPVTLVLARIEDVMHFIEANGVGLRYELTGNGNRTLVLIHEMGGSLESWDEVAPRLAAGRRVLPYDTRGAGLSEKVRG